MGMKMGEGWLLTAEMLELIDEGVRNIVCAQPFGCLPNHIVGKGMMNPIRSGIRKSIGRHRLRRRRYADQSGKPHPADARQRQTHGHRGRLSMADFRGKLTRFFMGRYARNDAFCTARY